MAEHILFITLSNIGDAVMTTPVLERLHQLWPEAVIDIVADPRSAELFMHRPHRGEIILKHKRHGKRGVLRLLRRLRRRRYDLIVDLRTDGLAWLLRGRRRLTKWRARPLGGHAVEHHAGVIAPLLDGNAIPPARIHLDEALRGEARQRLADLPHERLLALGPGANWPPKIWPARRFVELVERLRARFDGVLLLGGPGDMAQCRAVARDLPLPVLDLCGRTGLLEAAALLERARLFAGNDSGLGHLAAAVGTPTLTVFGPGQPWRYHPWGPHACWVRAPDGKLESLDAARTAAALDGPAARADS